MKASFLVDGCLLTVTSYGGRGYGAIWGLFCKGTNTIYDLITSQRPPPSETIMWRVGFQHLNLGVAGGTQQFIARGHISIPKRVPSQIFSETLTIYPQLWKLLLPYLSVWHHQKINLYWVPIAYTLQQCHSLLWEKQSNKKLEKIPFTQIICWRLVVPEDIYGEWKRPTILERRESGTLDGHSCKGRVEVWKIEKGRSLSSTCSRHCDHSQSALPRKMCKFFWNSQNAHCKWISWGNHMGNWALHLE